MSALLEGKVIVIIGGTTGIGLSAARAFIGEGARVVVVGRHAETVAAAASQLGPAARALSGDAVEPATAEKALAEAQREFGGFHGLYHVAGGSGRRWGDGPLHELSDEGWRATLDLNLTSVMNSNRAAVRQFLSRGSGGCILNTTSVLADSPSPLFFSTLAYATAKAGIIGLTRSCAATYAPKNIRFNALAPGLVATPMSRRAQESAEVMNFIQTKQPLDGGRIGQPSDLDSAAVYFMSDAAKFVTGQVLAVDGGWSVTEG